MDELVTVGLNPLAMNNCLGNHPWSHDSCWTDGFMQSGAAFPADLPKPSPTLLARCRIRTLLSHARGSRCRGNRVRLRVLESRYVVAALTLVDGLLVLVYVLSQRLFVGVHPTIAHMFDLDGEGNAATWYASSQLLLASAMSLLIGLQVEGRSLGRFYYLLAAAFLFFSADEAAVIHEPLAYIVRGYSFTGFLPGPDHVTWMLPYLAVMVVLLIVMRRGFLLFLRSFTHLRAFLAGAVLWILGAMAVEVVGYYVLVRNGGSYSFQVALEEACELLGVIVMIYALMRTLYSFDRRRGESRAGDVHADGHPSSIDAQPASGVGAAISAMSRGMARR